MRKGKSKRKHGSAATKHVKPTLLDEKSSSIVVALRVSALHNSLFFFFFVCVEIYIYTCTHPSTMNKKKKKQQ